MKFEGSPECFARCHTPP